MKNLIKKLFHLFQLDIKRYNLAQSEDLLLKSILRNFDIHTVIDVGANIGQYGQGLIDHGYSGQILSFEPIPSVFEQLRRRAERHPNWKAFNLGMGSVKEERTIHISENFVSSSVLEIEAASLKAEPRTRTVGHQKIELSTIDDFLRSQQDLAPGIFVKLDIQGYELEALKGAGGSLSRIKVIQAELSFVPLYHRAPLYDEVIAFLRSHGFDIFTIIPGFRNDQTGQLLQADGIFVRQ